MKKSGIVIIFFLFTATAFGKHDPLDSLKTRVKLLTNKTVSLADTNRVQLLQQIAKIFYRNAQFDSAVYYLDESIKIAGAATKKHLSGNRYVFSFLKAGSYAWKAKIFRNAGNPDSAIAYHLQAIQVYRNFIERTNDISLRNKAKKSIGDNFYGIGIVHYYQSNFDSAKVYYLKASDIYSTLNTVKDTVLLKKAKMAMAGCYNNVGLINYSQGNYAKAVENILKSLKISEELKNKEGVASGYNNLGLIHKDQKNYGKAIDYYRIALKLNKENKDKAGMASCYNNLGNVYEEQGANEQDSTLRTKYFDNAISQYLMALKNSKDIGDKLRIANAYNNIGAVQQDKKEYELAVEYYLKALKLYLELGDKNNISTVYANLASLEVALAKKQTNPAQVQKHLNDAINYGTAALQVAKEINATPSVNFAAKTLMKAYSLQGDYRNAFKYAGVYIDTKDSMFTEEKAKVLTEAEKKFESEKKQLLIEKLNKENQLKDVRNKKQQVIIFSFIIGLIIVLTFSIIISRLFLQKKKANILLARQKQQIEVQNAQLHQANEEIMAQRDEIASQRDMVLKQKEYIEYQKTEIEDSIRYAKNIQTAVLPSSSFFENLFGSNENHFVLFRPKATVSGDFYWAKRIKDTIILTVADCTGHGVPGAFMSMLAVSFLNEIVNKKEITDPGIILNELRDYVIEALKQRQEEST